jgi:hypothetical protein
MKESYPSAIHVLVSIQALSVFLYEPVRPQILLLIDCRNGPFAALFGFDLFALSPTFPSLSIKRLSLFRSRAVAQP